MYDPFGRPAAPRAVRPRTVRITFALLGAFVVFAAYRGCDAPEPQDCRGTLVHGWNAGRFTSLCVESHP